MSGFARSAWDGPASWWDTGVVARRAVLWRGVEAQHLVATMRLVDSSAEQLVLEQLLEGSKPPLPLAAPAAPVGPGADGTNGPDGAQHYLLVTPFRYTSPHGSRFRRGGTPGLWYGAEDLRTACAEVTYWRWRFLVDSDALRLRSLVTEHTFFAAVVDAACSDLTADPWSAWADRWQQRDDYSACQHLAAAARARPVDWIRYASVREPGGHCGAVLNPAVLALAMPQERQTWVCKVNAGGGWMSREGQGHAWQFTGPTAPLLK